MQLLFLLDSELRNIPRPHYRIKYPVAAEIFHQIHELRDDKSDVIKRILQSTPLNHDGFLDGVDGDYWNHYLEASKDYLNHPGNPMANGLKAPIVVDGEELEMHH